MSLLPLGLDLINETYYIVDTITLNKKYSNQFQLKNHTKENANNTKGAIHKLRLPSKGEEELDKCQQYNISLSNRGEGSKSSKSCQRSL